SINLLETPQKGQIIIDELKLDYAHFSAKEALALRSKSAMVFQHHNLFINKNATLRTKISKANIQGFLLILSDE
ncbi:hypothetical protein JVW02_19715, partial [Vibrio cholerae O1]|nr:hypothetical protein [Vibrio cholerae O1]